MNAFCNAMHFGLLSFGVLLSLRRAQGPESAIITMAWMSPLPFSFPSHPPSSGALPSFPSHQRSLLFFVLQNQSSELRHRERESGERGVLLLNLNGPNEQSPLHLAILQLMCVRSLSLLLPLAPSCSLFSADNTFGKRQWSE